MLISSAVIQLQREDCKKQLQYQLYDNISEIFGIYYTFNWMKGNIIKEINVREYWTVNQNEQSRETGKLWYVYLLFTLYIIINIVLDIFYY
jgi:hypothetical protein